jgi:ADP-heptose:LPS heptosyltransferase
MMDSKWNNCRKILCIRLDNMGDLLMTSPALAALKETFNCHITILCSSLAAGIAADIASIDDILVFDAPWMKLNGTANWTAYQQLVETIAAAGFDGAIIFTVYSQNPLPAAMLAFHAGIPLRMAYCRENPYELLTHWLPDPEPLQFIRHQVERDLQLVQHIGAHTSNRHLQLRLHHELWPAVQQKLESLGVDVGMPWVIVHPGVSDEKRKYNVDGWRDLCKSLQGMQVIVTGTAAEYNTAETLALDTNAINAAGMFELREFALLISRCPLVITVNTGTAHIAAATGTPVIVLYALTNLQHTPWMTPHRVLYFDVPESLRSRNELLRCSVPVLAESGLPAATHHNIIKAVEALTGKYSARFFP